MIQVPQEFRPTINTVYPPSNHTEFERWFGENWQDIEGIDREYIQIYFCGFQVNSNYGNDKAAMQRLQDFVDTLPIDKKYFCISQYDDGVGVDWKGKDVLEFNMSKKGEGKYPLPLLGQEYYYSKPIEKKWLFSFVGNMTHPIREHAKSLIGINNCYISFLPHDYDAYMQVIAESKLVLCYRGYGISSFRVQESILNGAIPVYISTDADFIEPYHWKFSSYGLQIKESELPAFDEIIGSALNIEGYYKNQIQKYKFGYTYSGCMDLIIKHLRHENI